MDQINDRTPPRRDAGFGWPHVAGLLVLCLTALTCVGGQNGWLPWQ